VFLTSLHTVRFKFSARLLVAAFFSAALAGCTDNSDSRDEVSGPDPLPEPTYTATIARTAFGTPHVTAPSWGSLGFGQGYAFAEDRFCVLADQIVKVRSQRARFFGAGEDNSNILSDFAYLGLAVLDKAETAIAGLSPEGREMLEGYVAGYNQYLGDTGADSIPGGCAGQEWVGEIDANSLMAFYLDVAMLAGSRNFLDAIANAAPPGGEALGPTRPLSSRLPKGAASNGVAMGGDNSATGKGLLLSNTHLPWEGELRYHEMHLTIPEIIDVAGVSISGAMGIQIGFNESMAWTHTTSPSNQFIIYTLELVPGNPTRYRFGDEERDMTAQVHSIEVLAADGNVSALERTLYSSHYGPMLDPSAFGLAWTGSSGYSIYDMNADNGALMDTFLSMARAESVDALREVFESVGGVPWNHTMAADDTGALLYADTTLVPNLSTEAEAAFRAEVESDDFSFAKIAFGLGVVALDGSDPLFSIDIDDDATLPGAIPFSEAPKLLGRRDFVANSNDSYWLSNPAEPLRGYSIRYGEIETPRSLRTRMGLTQILAASSWNRIDLEEMLFENRSYTALLWQDSFANACTGVGTALSNTGDSVDIRAACAAISNWDGRFNLDSSGAISFREVLGTVDSYGLFNGISYFTVPFDVSNPVATPGGLSADGEQYLLSQLADAVNRLESVGIAPEDPLGDHQYTLRGDQRFAVHGGQQHSDGAYNKVQYTFDPALNSSLLPQIPRPEVVNAATDLTKEGYLMNYGGSFIMAVEFTDEGPVADAILTYSQSDDPQSPHFSDQTALYSSKTWRALPFTREQIEADPAFSSKDIDDL
jgi:acyl-homoserine-lactone acylase